MEKLLERVSANKRELAINSLREALNFREPPRYQQIDAMQPTENPEFDSHPSSQKLKLQTNALLKEPIFS